MALRRLLSVFLFVCLCKQVWGRCETLFPGDSATRRIPSACYGVVDYDVYVRDDTCQAAIETQYNTVQWPIIWKVFSDAAGPQCARYAAELQCQSIYRSCSPTDGLDTEGSLPAETGLPPCRELCEAVVASCPGALLTAGSLTSITNCSLYQPEASGLCNMQRKPVPVVQQPQCVVYNGTACRGIVDQYEYPGFNYWGEVPPSPVPRGYVYVTPGFTIEQLEYQAQRKIFLYSLAGARNGCDKFMAPYVCSQIFFACDPYTRLWFPPLPPLHIPFPRFPCHDVCTDYEQACDFLWTDDAGVIDTKNVLLPNCSARTTVAPGWRGTCDAQGYSSSPFQGDFPTNSSFFYIPKFPPSFDQLNIYTSCNNLSRTAASVTNEVPIAQYALLPLRCPSPLVIPEDPLAPTVGDGRCATPCPVLLFSEEDYDNVDILQSTLVGFSFVLSFWVALTWVIFKVKRQQKYVLYFNLSIFMIECMLLSFVLDRGPGKHVASVGCKDNSQTVDKRTDPGWCIPGGVLVLWAVMVSTGWWFFSATDLFLKIVLTWRPLETSRANKMKETFFRVSAPGLPILLLAIGLGEDVVGAADLGVAWCQFHARNPQHRNLEWTILYFPVLGIALFTFAFMISIMVSLHRSAHATGTSRRKGWWKRYLRPIMFLAAFLAIFLWIFVFRVIAYYQTDAWLESATDWVRCLLVDQPAGLRECSPGKPSYSPNVILWNLIHIAVAGSGIYTFMIYGIMEENFRLWAKLLGDCCGNDFCRIWGSGAAQMRHRSSTVTAPKKGSKGNDAVQLNTRSEDE